MSFIYLFIYLFIIINFFYITSQPERKERELKYTDK